MKLSPTLRKQLALAREVIAGKRRWAVLEGDAYKILPHLAAKSVDHMITDPAYEAEAHAGARTSRSVTYHPGRHAGSRPLPPSRNGPLRDGTRPSRLGIDFAPLTDAQRQSIAHFAGCLVRRWCLAFCQVEAVAPWRAAILVAGGKWRRAAAWVKPDCAPQFNGNGWAQGFECIAAAWFGRGDSLWNGGGARGVFAYPVNGQMRGERQHPTQKPLGLLNELVRLFTDRDDVILDPFGGVGSIGVAALRHGRRVITIERNRTYARIARRRLAAEAVLVSSADVAAGQLAIFSEGA